MQNWFQNRRAKTKIDRRNQEGLESLQQLRTRDEILGKEVPRHETALDELLEELAAELEESARRPEASPASPSDAIGGENAQLENDKQSDGGGTKPRLRSQKSILSDAVGKADKAVRLDHAQSFEGAVKGYEDACDLLEQVIIRTSTSHDQNKLEAIVSSFSAFGVV